ncbi:MAG: hypothetical protein V8T12_06495, partial [Parabacteroides johnsonii]
LCPLLGSVGVAAGDVEIDVDNGGAAKVLESSENKSTRVPMKTEDHIYPGKCRCFIIPSYDI